jgi:iron complex outermembrane receptor protein
MASRSGNDYEAGGGAVVPADFDSDEVRFAAEWDVGENDTLSASIGYQDQGWTDYPGKPMNAESFDVRSYRVGYEQRSQSDRYHGARTSLFMNRSDHLMNNDEKPTSEPDPTRVPPFPILAEAISESDNVGGQVAFDWSHPGVWSLTAGMDAYDLQYDARREMHRRDTGALTFEGVINNNSEILDVGAFAQQTFFLGERAEWLWGLRLDGVIADSDEPSDYFLQNTSGDLRQEELNVSAGLSWNFRVSDRWNLTTSLGRAVRTANVLERYANRFPSSRFQIGAEFLGNPDIDPEINNQVDVGIRYEAPRFGWFVDTFYRQIDDYITILADPTLSKSLPASPDTVYRYINGDEARYVGFEAGSAIRFGTSWSARLQAQWLEGDDEELDEPALGVPPLSGSVALRYSHQSGKFYVEGKARIADRQDRVASSRYEKETPGYTVFDLRAGLRVSEGLSILLIGRNLTDKFYVNHLNAFNPFSGDRIAEPGRLVALSGAWEF